MTNLQSSDIVLCHTTALVRTTTRYFKFALANKCYFPFAVWNSTSLRFKMSKQYPGPRGISWFFLAKEIKNKPRSDDNESRKRRGEREKNPCYLCLESHFHADDRVRIWSSGVDWFIFFQTRKPIWLARKTVTTEGTLRIFTPQPLSTREENCLYTALAITFARDQGT